MTEGIAHCGETRYHATTRPHPFRRTILHDKIIPAHSAKWLVRTMIDFGIPPQNMLRRTGLHLTWLDEAEPMISSRQYIQIIENALDESGDPALGLKVGKHLHLGEYGVWGYALISCGSMLEALSISEMFWELNGALVKPVFRYQGDTITAEIFPAFSALHGRLLVFAVEEYFSTLLAAITTLFPRTIPLDHVQLSYSEVSHAALYAELFPGGVQFDAEINRFSMSAHYLDIPTVMGHPTMLSICRKQCEEMLASLRQSDALVDHIRQLIINSSRRCVKIDDVAHTLGLSRRTLSRRLHERNTSFQHILDTTRAELAREYLEKTDLNIAQISERVGFSETNAFRLAFKRWQGISASTYRSIHRRCQN